jgi:hypothetical protein
MTTEWMCSANGADVSNPRRRLSVATATPCRPLNELGFFGGFTN